jgi:hypothetical protein
MANAFSYPAVAAHFSWNDAAGNSNRFSFDLVVSETWDEDATVTEHPVEQGADVTDHVRVQLRKVELKVWATNEPIDANNWDQATVQTASLDLPGQTWETGPGQVTIPVWDNPIILRSLAGSLVGLAGGLIGGALGGAKAGMIAGDIAALVGLEAAFLLDPASVSPDTIQTDAGLLPKKNATQSVQVQQWPGGSDGTDYVAMTIAKLQLLKNTAQQIFFIGTKSFCSPMVIEKLTHVRSADTGSGADITIGLKEVRIVTTQTVPAPIPNLPAGGGVPPSNKGTQDAADASPTTSTSAAKQLAQAIKGLPPGGIASILGAAP